MTTLFGRRVIGDEAYEKQAQMIAEGRHHFGPRVVGPTQSFHGKGVVGTAQAAEQQAVSDATGAIARLDDLKHAELKAICERLGIEHRPVGESNASLIAKIRAKYAEVGAVPMGGVAASTAEADLTADDLVNAPAAELPALLREVTRVAVVEEAFRLDEREWALEAYARRAQELGDGHTAK